MKFTLLPLSIIALFCYSCRTGSEKGATQDEEQAAVLQFADAKQFESGWSRKNVLVVLTQSDPVALSPTGPTSYNAATVMGLTQGYLVVIDQMHSGEVVPQLAKSLPAVSDDGLQYTYELRDDAAWDDGSPITSADVIFTMKAAKCPLTNNPAIKPYLENVKEVLPDPANPKMFTVVMKTVYVQNLDLFSSFPVLSQKFYDPGNVLSHYSCNEFDSTGWDAASHADLNQWSIQFNDGKYSSDPAFFYGAGPYKVESWDHGSMLTLVRKKNHWTQKASNTNIYLQSYPEKIIFRIVREESAQVLEFKSQSVDATNVLSTKALTALRADSAFNHNYNSAFMQNLSNNFIALNMHPDGVKHKKIFDDERVRRAMALATPVDQIIKLVVLGKAVRWPCCTSPLRAEFNADLPLLPLDIEGSKKMLEEAGWTDRDGDGVREKMIDGVMTPLEVEFTYGNQGNLANDIARLIVESAQQAGIKVDPKAVGAPVLLSDAQSHDFDMILLGLSASSVQKDYTQQWHTQSWLNNGSNFSGFGDHASDALIDSIKRTLNDSMRIAMSKRLQKMIYDAQPDIFLYSTFRKMAIHKRFGNQLMSSESPNFILGNLRLLAPATTASLLDDVN